MRGRSYTPSSTPPPPPRGHGRRGPSPTTPRGGRDRDLSTSLFVRNLSHDCSQKDLRSSFEQFGALKDIYLPRDYYTGDPRGFGYVEFEERDAAAEAKRQMDGNLLLGRELSVMFAKDNRKKPSEMRARQRGDGRFRGRRRSLSRYYSRSPGSSRSPPPSRRHHHLSRRSISPRKEGYDKRRRSYSRSPAYNGSRGHSASPARSKRRSISRSTPRRSISRSPSPRRRRSNTPLPASSNRSPRPRRRRSSTPLPASRNMSPRPRRRRSKTPLAANRNRSPSPKRRKEQHTSTNE